MTDKQTNVRFRMNPPAELKQPGRYGFWLLTDEKNLLVAVRTMTCVAAIKRRKNTDRVLVEISDQHDPDEAWHWIRAELEDAANYVQLDKIWEDAIKWVL